MSQTHSHHLSLVTRKTSNPINLPPAYNPRHFSPFISSNKYRDYTKENTLNLDSKLKTKFLGTLPANLPSFCFEMLAVFEKSISKPPNELVLPFLGKSHMNSSREEIAEIYRSWRLNSTFSNLPNGNFLALSHEDENPAHPRSIVVMDDIFCLFSGYLLNPYDLQRYYGLSRQATEAMIIVEVYKVLRNRAAYPSDQVVKELDGKFAFILFDSKASVLFLDRDRDGCVRLHWGTAADSSLACTDDPKVISASCGKCYAPFPPGCLFLSGGVLISVDYLLHKVRGISRQDDEGNINVVIFQVDLYTRLHSIHRTGSADNWADVTIVEGE